MKKITDILKYSTKAACPLLAVLLVAVYVPGVQAQDFSGLIERGEAAGIDRDRLERLVERAQNQNYDDGQIRNLIEPAIKLAENNLPYNFVIQKSMEGLAKRVPAENVHRVLAEFERGVSRAAEIIDPWLEQEEVRESVEQEMAGRELDEAMSQMRNNLIQSSAQALQQNVNEASLNSFLNDVTRISGQRGVSVSSVASSVRVMADMPTSADNPDLSNEILLNAIKSGFSANQVQQLPAAMNAAQFFSQLPAEAIGRGINEQIDRGAPGRQVLENLFKGDIQGGPPGMIPPGLDGVPGRGDDERRGPPSDPPGGPPNGG